jgi:hypothetical protein
MHNNITQQRYVTRKYSTTLIISSPRVPVVDAQQRLWGWASKQSALRQVLLAENSLNYLSTLK